MTEFITIEKQIERKTYLKGSFKGKFIGFIDFRKSDIKHENFYDLEVLSGEITANINNVRRWKEGDEFEDFINVETFLTKLPDSIPCTITYSDNDVKHFKIHLNEPKLSKYNLTNQHYEGNKVFGDIEGEISGYLKHYDIQYQEVEVLSDDETVEPIVIIPSAKKTNKQSGKIETNGDYKRWEYFNSDGTTYWKDWQYQGNSGFNLWNFLGNVLRVGMLLLFIVPILIAGWQVILPIALIIAGIYLFSAFQNVLVFIWKWLLRLLSFGLVAFFIYSFLSLLKFPTTTTGKRKITVDDTKEVESRLPDPTVLNDSIISHHRIWTDYNNKVYSANLEVRMSDFRNSNSYRNNLSNTIQNSSQYNSLVSLIYNFDKTKMQRIYSMFDSLRMQNNLNEIQFAEVITTCVQDIPYTLILENACNPNLYNDEFINNYLKGDGQCEGNIKFGLFTPIEFMGNLEGDCDTRTLWLFTILNHYNFDVAIFGSEFYKHSLIGIVLPLNGISKTINGKKYIMWETTTKDMKPGMLPHEISDMRFWNVNLISNNQTI